MKFHHFQIKNLIKKIPNTNIGIAKAEILIFKLNETTNQVVAVSFYFSQILNLTLQLSLLNPQLINEIVITES